MPLDFNKFPVIDREHQERERAAAQAFVDERIALLNQAISRALPDRTQGQVANAALWLAQWLPEYAWDALDCAPYPINPDTEATLRAYRRTLEQV